jgi:hypothetical protein
VLVKGPSLIELAFVPAFIPVTCKWEGALHVYLVPAGTMPSVPFTGLTVNVPLPSHIALVKDVLIAGLAFTVIFTTFV